MLAAAGVVVSALFAGVVPLMIELVLRRDVVDTGGMLAGVETQPAALAFATERTAATPGWASPTRLCSPPR